MDKSLTRAAEPWYYKAYPVKERARMKRLFLFLVILLLLPAACLAENARFTYAPDPSPFAEDAELFEIYSLNSGSSDCFLLVSGGATMMVDGGIKWDTWRVERFLEDRGIKTIDCFFLTHCHDDHVTGFTRLMVDGYSARVAYGPYPARYKNNDVYFGQFINRLEKGAITYTQVFDGDKLSLGEAELTVIRNTTGGLSLNDGSLVLRVDYRGRSAVFLADISSKSCKWMAQNRAELMDCELVKANHHGFAPMYNELMEAISPTAILVPNARVAKTKAALKQYTDLGLRSFFNADGIIHAMTDGEQWYIEVIEHYEAE